MSARRGDFERVKTVQPRALSICLVFLASVVACEDDSRTPVEVRPESTATKRVVLMRDSFFSPKDIVIEYGDTVVWFSAGGVSHTSTSGTGCTSDGLWGSPFLVAGESYSVVFDSTGVDSVGVIPYYCIPHCFINMTGTVTINPSS